MSGQAFKQLDGKNAKSTLNQEVKNDLRRAHFKFGNDGTSYETTNKRTFSGIKQGAKVNDKKTQMDRMQKMRSQNFIYGTDVPVYQSMAKKDFQRHDTNEAVKNLHQSKLNGKELRKSHFQLGTDQVPYENQKDEKKAVGDAKSGLLGSSVVLRKSNFTLEQTAQGGGDFFTYETVNGTQMAQVKNNPVDKTGIKQQQ